MSLFIDHQSLRKVVACICTRAGSEDRESRLVADNLVMANLMGHDSHGVGMLPRYVECVLDGTLKPNMHARIALDSGALVIVDGQAGYGQVIGGEAMDIGIERAAEHGVAVVGTRNSFHLCRIGAWAERCAEAGFVSMHHTNVIGHRPLVAPYGGRQPRYATNPYTVGLPASDESPMTVLDMATSMVALGKVRVARNKGERLAPGILLDPHGEPTTDPEVMYQEPSGAVLPFGGHKGGGLGLINELLAGVLTGGHTMRPETTPESHSIINNMLSIIIDPRKLIDDDFYQAELDASLGWIKRSKPLDPTAPVLAPGEPERLMKTEREANGIPVDANTWEEILVAGDAVGFPREEIVEMSSTVAY